MPAAVLEARPGRGNVAIAPTHGVPAIERSRRDDTGHLAGNDRASAGIIRYNVAIPYAQRPIR